MAAKTKKGKNETIIPEEEVESEKIIEVKTSKKEPKKELPEIETEESLPDIKSDKSISSFSQLDSDKDLSKEEKEDEKSEEKPVKEEPEKEEPAEEEKEEAKDWTPSEEDTEEIEEKPSKTKILLVIFVVAIIGLIVGGVFYYRSRVSKTETTDQPEPTPTASEETPTPTEELVTEEVDYSEYKVSILNGSGIIGEAGKVEDLISDLGFDSIETDNAESYDFQTTEISMKEDTPDAAISAIEELIGESFTVERTGTSLAENSTYDIIIIVGTKK